MKTILTILALLLVVALGALGWYLLPTRERFYTDADTIRQPVETANTRDILWQPPIGLDARVNTPADDYEPRASADGSTLFFVRGKAGQNADIFVAERTPGGWTDPEPLAAVNSKYEELGPEPSSDGQTLYFYSDRLGGVGGYDLWVTHRGTDGWRVPVNLGLSVNTGYNEYGPALTLDGRTLYFSSNRPRPDDARQPDSEAWPATVREDLFRRDYDLYSAPITAAGVGQAEPLVPLNTPYDEGPAAVSPFGDFLYFSSDRPGGEGGFDLYRARRMADSFLPPENLGTPVNTPANELDAGLTLGGYGLFFSSDRPTQSVASADAETASSPPVPRYDIYYTTSREVFVDAETRHRSIDWAALWTRIGPNLLWALLALLLLLALFALLRGVRDRRLSLLARCLLASLMTHLLLLLLFNFWEVTAGIADALTRKGAIKVALVSADHAGDITAQIRGQWTETSAPAPPTITAERPQQPVHVDAHVTLANLIVERRPLDVAERPSFDANASDAPTPSSALSPAVQVLPVALKSPAETSPAALTLPPAPRRIDRPDPEPVERTETVSMTVDRAPTAGQVSTRVAGSANQVQLPPAPDAAAHADAESGLTARLLRGTGFQPVDSQVNLPSQTLAAPLVNPQVTSTDTQMAVMLSLPDAPDPPSAGPEPAAPRVSSPSPTPPRGPVSDTELPDTMGLLASLAPTDRSVPFVDAESLADAQSIATEAAPAPHRVAPLPPPAPLTEPLDRAAIRLAQLEEPPTRGAPDETASAVDAPPPVTAVSPSASIPRPDPQAAWHRSSTDETDVANPDETIIVEMEPSRHARSGEPPDSTGSLASIDNPAFASFAPTLRAPEINAPQDYSMPQHARRDFDANVDRDPASLLPNLRIPTEVVPPENPYAQRAPDQRRPLLESMGGSDATEHAVARALAWLAEHQCQDGRWDADGFDDGCGACGGETEVDVDIAVTGLSLLAFLGADHTHVKTGPYQSTVAQAVDWLLNQQDENGDLRGRETMYSHGIATIALAEALSMSADAHLKDPVERAVAFIERARDLRTGGWRYEPGQAGDTSVLGWQVMALHSARLAGVNVSPMSLASARRWLDQVSTPRHPGLYAYQPNRPPSPAMTAEAMFVQQLLGRSPDEPRMRESALALLQILPDWESQPNTYYWYYATLALFQRQGPDWSVWNDALTGELLTHQRDEGGPAGSWDPADEWARIGGRVYQTALCTLMLEVYYRYLPMYADAPPADAIGTIRGTVTNADTGDVLAEATVRIDLPDAPPQSTTTGPEGSYMLFVPQVPDHFALSASLDGFVPAAQDVSADDLEGNVLDRDFALHPHRRDVIAFEHTPEVHHLGNDRFEGRVNSQFQRTSEGRVFSAQFHLSTDQLPSHDGQAVIRMLTKGVQCPHRIRVNGHLVVELDESPRDGSFGEFAAPFDADALHEGDNALTIQAVSCHGDLDDFEFINLRIELSP